MASLARFGVIAAALLVHQATATTFTLYAKQARDTAGEPLTDVASVDACCLNPDNTVVFLIHDYIHLCETDYPGVDYTTSTLKDAIFAAGPYDVIEVDWQDEEGTSYTQAERRIDDIGLDVAALINILTSSTKAVALADIHLIGRGVGAHIAGYAGKQVAGIGRVTGLDPAGGLSYSTSVIASTDATIVDIVHTHRGSFSKGFLGSIPATGTHSFLVNTLGKHQPDCDNTLVAGKTCRDPCNHIAAYDDYLASIATPPTADACDGSGAQATFGFYLTGAGGEYCINL